MLWRNLSSPRLEPITCSSATLVADHFEDWRGGGLNGEMVLKAGLILYLEFRRFTCEHVARTLVENTAAARMTRAGGWIGILFAQTPCQSLHCNIQGSVKIG